MKVKLGFVKRTRVGQFYLSIHGWPFNGKESVPYLSEEEPLLSLSQDTAIKLNIGGGKGHPKVDGWTIVDLRSGADIVIDITQDTLPYTDDSVDVIFTSHTLEHIYPQQLGTVLSEFYRVLKPKQGLLRIGVPDIELAIQAYRDKDYGFFRAATEVSVFDREAPIGGLLASWFYSTRRFADPKLPHGEGHVHCFDYDHLAYWLKKTGFKRIWRSAYQQSILPELRTEAFDRHPTETLFVESRK